MPVECQAVHHRVVIIGFYPVEGDPEVGRLQRPEGAMRENLSVGGELAEDRFGDVYAHLRQTGVRIIMRNRLMLVIIIVGYLDLAYRLG